VCSPEVWERDNFWTLTSPVLPGGPRAKCDPESFVCDVCLKIIGVLVFLVTFEVHHTMSPKVMRFVGLRADPGLVDTH
jgi:hypothetical protein